MPQDNNPLLNLLATAMALLFLALVAAAFVCDAEAALAALGLALLVPFFGGLLSRWVFRY